MPSSKSHTTRIASLQKTTRITQALFTNAVIYCRVSSAKQITEGDGLGGQENSCRHYAAMRGYEVLAVFTDGITGEANDRKGLLELLAFLGQQPPGIVVIIDDIKRFAREVEVHFALKRAITQAGARLESPLFRFEDTPEGKFIETMMAAQAELERNQNKRQVLSRMRARLDQGFWVFNTLPGYTYQRHPLAKKILVPDASAPIIREALEGFASERFHTIADVDRFLMSRGFYGQKKTYTCSRLTRVQNMLTSVLYAGWVEFMPWGVTLRKGQHKGLITYETYVRIQERLHKRSTLRTERVKRNVYPLRGVVLCGECKRLLTASRSRGKQGNYYNYYHCPNQSCRRYGKGIPCDKLEEEFAKLLEPLTLTDEEFFGATGWLELCQEEHSESEARLRERLEAEILDADARMDELIETLSKTRHELVIQSLEKKVDELSQKKTQIMARLQEVSREAVIDVGNLLERIGHLLKNPLLVWETGETKIRHLLAQIAFSGAVVYSAEMGFGTPELSLPYRVLSMFGGQQSGLVDPRRPFSNPATSLLPDEATCASATLSAQQIIVELQLWDKLLTDFQEAIDSGHH